MVDLFLLMRLIQMLTGQRKLWTEFYIMYCIVNNDYMEAQLSAKALFVVKGLWGILEDLYADIGIVDIEISPRQW